MSQIDSTLRVKLTQHWESNWLNIESLIGSTLRVKLTQHWELNWLKYSPVTHFSLSNYNSASDSTFRVKMTHFFLGAMRKKESFWPKKLSHLSWIETKTFIVLVTQRVTGSLVLLLKLLISKIHQNYCYINCILKWF